MNRLKLYSFWIDQRKYIKKKFYRVRGGLHLMMLLETSEFYDIFKIDSDDIFDLEYGVILMSEDELQNLLENKIANYIKKTRLELLPHSLEIDILRENDTSDMLHPKCEYILYSTSKYEPITEQKVFNAVYNIMDTDLNSKLDIIEVN